MTINNNITKAVNTAVAISMININRKLTILSIILGTIQAIFFFRLLTILIVKRIYSIEDPSTLFMSIISVSTVITGILEYKLLSLFSSSMDFQEQFFHDASQYLNILPYFRCVSVLITWLGIFLYLCTIFKNFGFVMIGKSFSSQKIN
jgi:hypothetical protein